MSFIMNGSLFPESKEYFVEHETWFVNHLLIMLESFVESCFSFIKMKFNRLISAIQFIGP